MKLAAGTTLIALALTACGSTVPLGASTTQDSLGPARSISTEPQGSTAPQGVITGQAPGGMTGATTNTTAGSTVNSGPDIPRVPGPGSVGAKQVIGSKEPVRIGVIYTPGADKVLSAAGLSGITTGDTKAQAEAVISWISAHGGLGGHPIQVFSHAMNWPPSTNDWQAACTAMTQDYKVRYVVTVITIEAGPNFLPCLAKGGVGLLNDNTWALDKTMKTYASALANPGEIGSSRVISVLVDDLWKRGWLTRGSKVGIFAKDSADGRAVVNGALTAALRRHGLTAASTQYVSNSDGGASQANGVVLQFRSAGVDRVFPALMNPVFLMRAASSQGYRPGYAVYSVNLPGTLLESTAPADQLKNAAGIGYQPFMDIGKGTKPAPVSYRETLCFDIMKQAGQASPDGSAKGYQAYVCNVLFYLKDLSDRQPTIPRDLLTTGRALIRDTFVSADTFRADVTQRTDGVAAYRSLAYRDDCSCFQYVSPLRPAP